MIAIVTHHLHAALADARYGRLEDTSPLVVDRAVAATHSGIVIADATRPGFPLTYVNRAFEAMTGYTASESLGRNCRFLQGPTTDRAAIAEVAEILDTGREGRVILLNHRKDGTPFYNELRLSPVLGDSGRVVQVVGVQNDVTELVLGQRTLERETDRAVAELRGFRDALPHLEIPPRPGLVVAGDLVVGESGIPTDFHLVAAGPRDATVLVVGSVAGSGLGPARRAVAVRTTLALCARRTDEPADLLTLANRSLAEQPSASDDPITALCVIYDPDSRRLRWAAAGRPPPVLLDSGMDMDVDQPASAALGSLLGVDCLVGEAPFSTGMGVLIATGGLGGARGTDAAPTSRQLGDTSVVELVRSERGRPPQRVLDVLRGAILDHGGLLLARDACFVAMRVT